MVTCWKSLAAATALMLVATISAAGELDLISASDADVPGNRASRSPAASADGRYVAFGSEAENLVTDDEIPWTGTDPDIFVRDREAGTTELVSREVGRSGLFWRTDCRSPALDGDGRIVAFECFNGYYFVHRMNFDIFLHDRRSGETQRVSSNASGASGNGSSRQAAVSGDGRYVAYASEASDLVPADGNGQRDIFLYDRRAGTTTLVSRNAGGAQGNGASSSPALSGDGRFLAFASAADNLVSGDDNGVRDIFLIDREGGEVERLSRNDSGIQGNGASSAPAISASGRYVAFLSRASNLVPGDTNGVGDVFLFDREKGAIQRVSQGIAGQQANGGSSAPSLSVDGRYVGFASSADNLVSTDSNGFSDVFRWDRRTGQMHCLSCDGDGPSDEPDLSADGRQVFFSSLAENFVQNAGPEVKDVFAYVDHSDVTPPEVELRLSEGLLWPPNKKYVDVLIDGAATDDSGSVSVEITLTDEYGEMVEMPLYGFGSTVALEAWREGDDLDGRTYTVTATATDPAGNRTVTTAEVVVPHDMRGKGPR